jgi:putative glutamine transport system substrate-binding protein
MKLKKLLALLLALALVFALAACGGSDDTSSDTGAATTDTTDTSDATASADTAADTGAAEATDTTYANGGKFRVGVKNAVEGFGYQDTLTGEYEGMEIDLANLLADALGYDEVEFTTVTAATRTELLDAGDIDCVIATFTITDERKESWDFSTPYYTDAITVLVEDASGITSLADLKDKTVGVSSGSTSAKALVEAMIDAGIIDGTNYNADAFEIDTWNDGVSFQQYADYPDISTALAAGEVDAFCVDKSILAIYKTDGRSYIDEKFSPQQYGVATKKDSELSGEIETLITQWLEDGTIDGLIEKWNLG